MTKKQLLKVCRDFNMRGYSLKNKNDLLDFVNGKLTELAADSLEVHP
jgi:hypothetical protein